LILCQGHHKKTIVGDDGVRDSEPTHIACLHKFFNILGRDGGEGLNLDPLGEVVDPNQDKLGLFFARARGADDVHSPDDERLWRYHVV